MTKLLQVPLAANCGLMEPWLQHRPSYLQTNFQFQDTLRVEAVNKGPNRGIYWKLKSISSDKRYWTSSTLFLDMLKRGKVTNLHNTITIDGVFTFVKRGSIVFLTLDS